MGVNSTALVALYLAAIVAANLVVARFGPKVAGGALWAAALRFRRR